MRSPGWRAQPRKPVPSYSSVSFRVFSLTAAQSKLVDVASTERKYDLYGPEFRADPHRVFAQMRERDPILCQPGSTASR